LDIRADNSVVRGFIINSFGADGILLHNGDGDLVAGNYIGVDSTGASAKPNKAYGIEIDASDRDTIGGTSAADGNLVSGNGKNGIEINDQSDESTLQGNLIGTDVTGAFAIPNVSSGVHISGQSTRTTIGGTAPGAGNLISGNGQLGVAIFGNTSGN